MLGAVLAMACGASYARTAHKKLEEEICREESMEEKQRLFDYKT